MIKTKWGSRVKFFTVLFGCFVLFSLIGENNQGKTAALTHEGCSSMGNPAYAYCTQIMGYEYQVTTDAEGGQDGVCIMPDGVECPQWDFYAGKCGQEQSYCVQHGMQLEMRNDGKDPFSVEYSVCVDHHGNEMGTLWSLSEFKIITNHDNDQFNLPMLGEQVDSIEILNNRAVPASFDWRNFSGANWMTPVKNQSTCGSCWAFSAVGLAEAQHNIMANDPNLKVNLAEQYLVSTCFNDPWGDGDCSGGREPYALQFIHESGVPDEDCYPYKAQNSSCSDRCSDYASRLKFLPNAYWSFDYTEQDIKFILSSYGPVTLGIGFDPDGAGAYWDGDIRRCTNDIPSGGTDYYIDHAVLAVGYNDAGGYWIVKNSWGSDWNEDGYFKLGYNECNVAHSRISWVESGLPGSNEAPTNITLSKSSVVEGQPIHTVVGTFSTADPNPGDTHTYTLVSGTGSTDNAAFTISGDQLLTLQVFKKATKDTYNIRVSSTDQDGLCFENTFTITVTEAGVGIQIYLPLIISDGGSRAD